MLELFWQGLGSVQDVDEENEQTLLCLRVYSETQFKELLLLTLTFLVYVLEQILKTTYDTTTFKLFVWPCSSTLVLLDFPLLVT